MRCLWPLLSVARTRRPCICKEREKSFWNVASRACPGFTGHWQKGPAQGVNLLQESVCDIESCSLSCCARAKSRPLGTDLTVFRRECDDFHSYSLGAV